MDKEQQAKFLHALARSGTGKELVKFLKAIEIESADIRNLGDTPATVRIDALKIWRSELLDKLLALTGQVDPPLIDEYK